MLEPNGPEQPKLFRPEATQSETGGEKASGSKPIPDSSIPVRQFERDDDQPWTRTSEALKKGELKRGTFVSRRSASPRGGSTTRKPSR